MTVIILFLLWLIAGFIGNILGFSLIDEEAITWEKFKGTWLIMIYGPLVIGMVFVVYFTMKKEE